MTKLYFKNVKEGEQTPDKLIKNGVEYKYPDDSLFDKLDVGEEVEVYKNGLHTINIIVKSLYQDSDNVPTINYEIETKYYYMMNKEEILNWRN